jgi:hypothetical protein
MTEIPPRRADTDEPLLPGVVDIVAALRPTTVAEVAAGLERLYHAAGGAASPAAAWQGSHPVLDAADGLAAFSFLYHDITADILRRMDEPRSIFSDLDYLNTLDVNFASRYLDALRTYHSNPHTAPKCWSVLFARRSNRRISRFQFAVAGVNAHVNYDLPFAVLKSAKNADLSESEHLNFTAVNDVFHERIPVLRHHFEDELPRSLDQGDLDTLNNRIDDVLVDQDRVFAWAVAERLVANRDDPGEIERIRSHLDAMVANVNRALLMELPFGRLLGTRPDRLVAEGVERLRDGVDWIRRHTHRH